MRRLLALALLLMFACGTEAVDRAKWQQMNAGDRLLYVKSLIGAEQVKESKGGNDRTHPRPAEEYVAAIERAYASGDQRTPEEIFATLGTPR
jgi:hypothetical protein